MRINRFLASCGLGSRRKMDVLVDEGRVHVNGVLVETKGIPVDPHRDTVLVDGVRVEPALRQAVYMLNKPAGFLTTMHDPQERPTVAVFTAELDIRVFPIGRLDMDTEGLLLFTNDGKLAHRLAHPRYHVEKEYAVEVDAPLTPGILALFEQGVMLEEGRTSPASVKPGEKSGCFHIIICEGWKRQIRRMCEAAGLRVRYLERVRYAFLELGTLPRGKMRELSTEEVERLKGLHGP